MAENKRDLKILKSIALGLLFSIFFICVFYLKYLNYVQLDQLYHRFNPEQENYILLELLLNLFFGILLFSYLIVAKKVKCKVIYLSTVFCVNLTYGIISFFWPIGALFMYFERFFSAWGILIGYNFATLICFAFLDKLKIPIIKD